MLSPMPVQPGRANNNARGKAFYDAAYQKKGHHYRGPWTESPYREMWQAICRLIPKGSRVLEVGCGEGFMLDVVERAGLGAELTGVDFSEPAIAGARARLGDRATLEARDARELADDGRTFDLVMMLEVLEHIPQPEQMLPILEQLTNRYLLLSVPWEPFFRGLNFLRGKHLSAFGNDPEHVNHWGRNSFFRFVQRRFTILETPVVFPWTMVLAKTRPKN